MKALILISLALGLGNTYANSEVCGRVKNLKHISVGKYYKANKVKDNYIEFNLCGSDVVYKTLNVSEIALLKLAYMKDTDLCIDQEVITSKTREKWTKSRTLRLKD